MVSTVMLLIFRFASIASYLVRTNVKNKLSR